jgi:protein TonB
MGSSPFGEAARGYALSDDLAKICLPGEFKDNYRKLAWVDSICFLFLVVGVVGLKAPGVIHRPLSKLEEPMPVIFTPPKEQPKQQIEVKTVDLPPDQPLEMPQVKPIVAAADPSKVPFAVPVEGAVPAVQARVPDAPPPLNLPPPAPMKFNPDTAVGGSFPAPKYPDLALRNRYQGTVTIGILVDAAGSVTSAKVLKTSGFSVLDDSALRVVKTRWRFPPGGVRDLVWDCTFRLE